VEFAEWWASRDWAETRNWGVAIGGLIALGFAAATYVLNSQAKRTEQASRVYALMASEHMATKGDTVPGSSAVNQAVLDVKYEQGHLTYTAKSDHIRYTYTIVNGSDQIIGPVTLSCEFRKTDDTPVKMAGYKRIVAPESTVTLEFLVEDADFWRYDYPQSVLRFRDSSGRWWLRAEGSPIRRTRPKKQRKTWTAKLRSLVTGKDPKASA
jgi:hypothetical protein